MPEAPRTGSCLCGAVRFTLHAAPTEMEACHCDACRRTTGGAPFFGMAVAKDAIRFEGAENITVYRSSDWAERGFCRICGSNLFFRMAGEAETKNIGLCPGTLDDMNGIALTSEMFIDAKPDSYALAGERKRITAAEAGDMLAAHLAAQRGEGRP